MFVFLTWIMQRQNTEPTCMQKKQPLHLCKQENLFLGYLVHIDVNDIE